ncbi:hypothetical protein, partial [Streptomyces decoyicus]|uniref:hypothetical protein n=1 Tax=Streptomyces decoyicus TaxID=249567 RepID=UPI0033ABD355
MTHLPPRTVLVLDYPGRRVEARIEELGLEEHGYDVRYLLSQPLPRHHLAADYAEALLATHPVLDDVRAVLAFCMAAPLAQEVAARISCPLLVFFDGEPSSPEAIRCEFRQIQRSLAAGCWRSRRPDSHRTGSSPCRRRPAGRARCRRC